MLKIQHFSEIRKLLCVPKTQITFILSCVNIDIAGGTSLATYGLLNSRLKRRVEETKSSTIFVIEYKIVFL